jgi:hypothetical protein
MMANAVPGQKTNLLTLDKTNKDRRAGRPERGIYNNISDIFTTRHIVKA